jgi:hypothetical protein
MGEEEVVVLLDTGGAGVGIDQELVERFDMPRSAEVTRSGGCLVSFALVSVGLFRSGGCLVSLRLLDCRRQRRTGQNSLCSRLWQGSGPVCYGSGYRWKSGNRALILPIRRRVPAGESWMSQAPAFVHIGIPAAATVERMEVQWPWPGGKTVYPAPAEGETTVVRGPEVLFRSQFEAID